MIEEEIVNFILKRRPFTAIELTRKLYPADDSQYEKVLLQIKNYTEIVDYYDSKDVEVNIVDNKNHKQEYHTQTLYYPWEFNCNKYAKDFVFNIDCLKVKPPTYKTSSTVNFSFGDDDDDEVKPQKQKHSQPSQTQQQKQPAKSNKKHSDVKVYFIEPTKPVVEQPKVFEPVVPVPVVPVEKVIQLSDNFRHINDEINVLNHNQNPHINDEMNNIENVLPIIEDIKNDDFVFQNMEEIPIVADEVIIHDEVSVETVFETASIIDTPIIDVVEFVVDYEIQQVEHIISPVESSTVKEVQYIEDIVVPIVDFPFINDEVKNVEVFSPVVDIPTIDVEPKVLTVQNVENFLPIVETVTINININHTERFQQPKELSVREIKDTDLTLTPTPLKECANEEPKLITSLDIQRASYKKDIYIKRSIVLSLNLDTGFSIVVEKEKLVLIHSEKQCVIQANERGLTINKSFLDLALLPDDINIDVYNNKTMVLQSKIK